ncbi:retinoschisin-like [Clavelina lepadiformis]|uniref:retinoschisin-like n=1 Tax=Clavelina lepadiformis TaxID=159417 RepID=UPI0040419A6D
MAVFVKISSVFFFLVFVTSIQGQSEQICLNLQREPSERPLSTTHQGPPGRRGPRGAIGRQGTRGNPGPPGQCVCDLTEDEQKRLKLLINLNRVELCPLGIKSGRIRDADMTSSSVYSSTYAAHLGRLDGSGVWLAKPSEYHRGAWIQVDMKTPTTLTGVVTQGREAHSQWVTSYKISFGSSPDELEFIQDNYGNDIIFEGNTEQSSHVLNLFPRPITTRYVRLVAREFVARIAMRIEYVTC